jgi:magnesium chelatase subunit I
MKPQEPTTLGELRASGYRSRSVREELRENLLRILEQDGDTARVFPGIVGYEESVIPELENAVLAGHHIVLLGERGQAKTRLIRALVGLLDETVPAVEGCELHDDPLKPICAVCRRRAASEGDALPIVWIPRDLRYAEKLATPDVTIADLIGEIDPVRVAEGRYLSDEECIHYGLAARSHRGIFAINELPDLAEKVQVGLFNLMEERDLQIKGFKVRLPLDVIVVATANPEDYTSRGRIVTPLKDRFDVQVRTHYPKTVAEEVAIMEQEAGAAERSGRPLRVADFLKEIVARFTMEARKAPEVNQASGVSVRVTVNNYETLLANAEKRAIRCREPEIAPRVSDLHALFASSNGKLELEYGLDGAREAVIVDRLLSLAIKGAFEARLPAAELAPVVEYMGRGWGVAVSDTMPSADYAEALASIPGLRDVVDRLGPFESPGLSAAAVEFVFEGMHLLKKLNRDRDGGRLSYAA